MNQQDSCENQSISTFSDLGIESDICQILANKDFSTPTEIQSKAIPSAISGQDLIGIAHTGTGKTLAFALPIIQKLLGNSEQALIMVPTRELAWQVEKVFRSIITNLRPQLSLATLIGGVPIRRQIDRLRRSRRIIVATPGRLQDHLRRGTLNLNNCKTIVLDEADRMFDIGFAPEIKDILSKAPKESQKLLFSATMPKEIRKLVESNLKNPVQVKIKREETNAAAIEQELCIVKQEDKSSILEKILTTANGQSIIFAKTKMGTRKLAKKVYKMGYDTAELHSDRSMSQRKTAIDGFRKGKFQVLVATDIAARGIDISDIELVVNYDLPQAAEDYVHRIGRTGRAGKSGRAISLAAPNQIRETKKIEKVTSVKFELSDLSLPFDEKMESYSSKRRRPSGRRRNRRFSRNRR